MLVAIKRQLNYISSLQYPDHLDRICSTIPKGINGDTKENHLLVAVDGVNGGDNWWIHKDFLVVDFEGFVRVEDAPISNRMWTKGCTGMIVKSPSGGYDIRIGMNYFPFDTQRYKVFALSI